MPPPSPESIAPARPLILAAADLGSNSFRLQICEASGSELNPLVSLKETVRLAAGLDSDKQLDEPAQKRALASLKKFGQTLHEHAPDAVHAVATNTLRVAKNADEFLERAKAALGFPIEVISGHEEARLIYSGVAHRAPATEPRLVVDIGGGSTELIIGKGLTPLEAASLQMGCVGYSIRFFADGELNEANFDAAERAARNEMRRGCEALKNHRFDAAIGSSGTARALAAMIKAGGEREELITRTGLANLRQTFLQARRIERLKLKGLRPDRAAVIAGGHAIMTAVFEEFGLEEMQVTRAALREGVLYDLLDRAGTP